MVPRQRLARLTDDRAREAIIGSALGLAAGDCLGAALEGKPRALESVRDLVYERTVWTDDTQQALVLIEATVRHGRPDPDWVARRYLEMSVAEGGSFGLHRRTGSGFRAAVDCFSREGDWRMCGRPTRAGNGAAMRIAPVAVALATRDPDSYWKNLVEVSLVTHREVRALSGALAVAWAAASLSDAGVYPLANGAGFDQLERLSHWLREREDWLLRELPAEWGDPLSPPDGHEHQMSDAFAGLAGGRPSARASAFEWIARNASDAARTEVSAGDGFAIASVVSAVYLALCSTENFEETLVAAVNMGGDADTIGAMVGGMAGAAAGPGAVPERWLRVPGHEELRSWADALARGEAHSDLPDLVALESRLR